MLNGIQRLGAGVLQFFQEIGAHTLLFLKSVTGFQYMFTHPHLLLEQMVKIGVRSFPLVTVVSIFTGAVTSWQAAYQLKGLVSMDYLGGAASMAIFIELSPVLTGLVVAGRVGASIAAELGTMRVTEQIDALESLAIDPVRYLALPRITAGWTMLPMLVIYSNVVAHLGAYVVANALLDVSTGTFFSSVQRHFVAHNVYSGLIKALVFGGGTALIGCSIGFQTSGGAEGVGASTIKAFVYSSAFILVMDYVLATLLF